MACQNWQLARTLLEFAYDICWIVENWPLCGSGVRPQIPFLSAFLPTSLLNWSHLTVAYPTHKRSRHNDEFELVRFPGWVSFPNCVLECSSNSSFNFKSLIFLTFSNIFKDLFLQQVCRSSICQAKNGRCQQIRKFRTWAACCSYLSFFVLFCRWPRFCRSTSWWRRTSSSITGTYN